MAPAPWFPYLKRSPQVKLRLLCLPHAGGSASGFRRWQSLLPPTVEVWAAQPPGRETRFADPRFIRMDAWISSLRAAVEELVQQPYAVFGHSLGAVVGYELIRALAAAEAPLPRHFFASGREAPDALIQRITWNLEKDAFLSCVKELEGTPAELFNYPELLDLVIPVLRDDFQVYETYRHQRGPPLDCPITALGGSEDRSVDPKSLDGWAAHTTRYAGAQLFPGGHFFVQTEEAALCRFLAQRLGL